MAWRSLRVGTAWGVDVRIHATFWLLPMFVLLYGVTGRWPWAEVVLRLSLLVGVAASVMWHELGHVLAARRQRIEILDIVLTPLGGVARLVRMPQRARDEIVVALAGPLANLMVAGALGGMLTLAAIPLAPRESLVGAGFWVALFWANVALGLANLLPILPLDGGRVARSALSSVWGWDRATWWTARGSQVVAVALGMWAALARWYWLAAAAPVLVWLAENEWELTRFMAHRRRVMSDLSRWVTDGRRVPEFPREGTAESPADDRTPAA